MTDRFGRRHAYLLLLALVVAVYGRSLDDPFHFDDGHAIVANPNLRSLAQVPRYFVDPGAFSADSTLAMYRPVLLATFAANHAVSGLAAWSWHAVNVAVHGGVAALVYEVVLRLLAGPWLAFLAAALFAVHPVHSEAVYYVSSRSESLAALFALAALALHLGPARRGAALAEVGAFAAGLLTKSTAIALLPIVALVDTLLRPGAWRRRWRLHGALWAVAAAYLLITRDLVARAAVAAPVRGYGEQVWSQVKGLVYYASLLFVPRGLSVDHQFQLSSSPADPYAASAAAAVASALALAVAWHRSRPLALVLCLWFLAALAPASLVPLNVIVNEHRLYLSGVAFAAGGAWLAAPPSASAAARRGLLLLVPVLGLLSLQRGAAWDDEEHLWRDAVAWGPEMARPRFLLADALLRQGRLAEAAATVEAGLARDPGFAPGYHLLARAGDGLGQPSRALAALAAGLRRAESAQLWGLLAQLRRERALAARAHGRPDSATVWLERSADAYRRALALAPGEADFHDNLGNTYQELARPAEALPHHRAAVRLRPSAPASLNLGNTLLLLGRSAEAERAYRDAVERDPTYREAWLSLAVLYQRAGDAQRARQAYARAGQGPGGESR